MYLWESLNHLESSYFAAGRRDEFVSQERSCFMAIGSWIPILLESCLFIALWHTITLYFCTPPSFEYFTIFLRGALARVTARIRNAQWYKMPVVLVSGKICKNCGDIKRKGCSINAPTPTFNACWPPRYTHPRITWFRPSLCCNGTSLQAGSRLPSLIRCTSEPPPCRWRRCSRWRCVNLRISRSWDVAWCDTSLAVSL